ncbi:MAG: hypothetical protein Q7T86_09555 [Hyphomicrobiaceae bacterium]|nr:hypothetical protein [Hyphomicrobiaceae bacterium]
MSARSKLQWLVGGEGVAGIVSGLLTMALMVGLVFFLVFTTDPDARLNTASVPPADTGTSNTGESTGEAGAQ